MKLGRLPRGLAVAALAAVTVVPLAASAASAAPAAPTAYAVFGSAQPLVWGSSSSIPVGELHVPTVIGRTNNLGVASAKGQLSLPDERPDALSGDQINGLNCRGYDDKACKDPFSPVAQASHRGPDAAHSEQFASFAGRDNKFPGSINALTDCAGNCGPQVVRSFGAASGPPGYLAGYVSVGGSSASQNLTIDDRGRLVSTAISRLDNVSIGPKDEVHFSSLVTTSQASGAGPENSKAGTADLRINDFSILGNPVELTRAGLRTVGAGPSEQAAYDNGKALLKRLKDERGIVIELPNFDAQLTRTPAHVAVETQGLRIRFEQAAGPVSAPTLTYPLVLGHATAVVAALDSDKNLEVKENPNGGVTVESSGPAAAPVANPGTGGQPAGQKGTQARGGTGTNAKPRATGGKGVIQPPSTGVNPGPQPEGQPAPPAVGQPGSSTDVVGATPPQGNPDETAFGLRDVQNKLGLRGAHSVSRAFGVFLGLGLILPVARFLIRRLG